MTTYVLEKRQHLVVSRVVGNKEADVGIVKHSGDTDQTGTATRDNGDVLPGVLAVFTLAVHLVVHVGDSLTEGLDTGSGAVLPGGHGDVDGLRALKAALNVVFNLGSALAQVGPELRLFQEAILSSSLGAPDDASRGTSGVQTGMGEVTLVRSPELAVDLGTSFYACFWGQQPVHGYAILSLHISWFSFFLF